MALHRTWRDAQEWKKLGLPLSTTSNEACKLYDAVMTQWVGMFDDPASGGIVKCVQKLKEADPSFVLSQALVNGLDLMGTGRSPILDKEFQKSIDDMVAAAKKANLSEWEKMHVDAVKLCGEGHMSKATNVWERILAQYPQDLMALKFAHDAYFYLGYQPQMRDSIARVLPYWKEDMPHYGYLMGMYSFGLVETNFYEQAEKVARKGLDINKSDCWSTHSMAHALEMMGRQKDGIAFMSSTVQDWEPCGMLACHNFWHWTVYHVEKGEYQGALDIFDSQISERAKKSGAMLDIVDATSLLCRLEMEGVNVEGRWHDIYETCKPHTDDHLLAFNDLHVLMSCLGDKQKETTKKMMQSIEEFVRNGTGDQQSILREVGQSLAEAFVAYDEGDYAKAVDLLFDKRYKIQTIGGSNAQRDVFNLFFINAAIKSTKEEHKKLARQLLYERKAMKENAPMTDRMVARAMIAHGGD